MMSKKRLEWVDIARGILIIFVCIGHGNTYWFFNKWIYSFHVSAFFILSGMLFKTNSGESFHVFLVKKSKRLLLPYVLLGAIYIIIKTVLTFYFEQKIIILDLLKEFLLGRNIGSSWFIIALFLIVISEFFLHKLKLKHRLPIIACLFAIGFIINYYIEEQFFLNIPAVLVSILLFETGFLAKQYDIITKLTKTAKSVLITVGVSLCVSIISTLLNTKVNMFHTQCGNVLLYLAGALSGTYIVFCISIFMEKSRFLKKPFMFYGVNTFPILEFHTYPVFWLITAFVNKFNLLSNNIFIKNTEGIIYTLTALLILTPVILFLNRYLPWFVGKSRKTGAVNMVDS